MRFNCDFCENSVEVIDSDGGRVMSKCTKCGLLQLDYEGDEV